MKVNCETVLVDFKNVALKNADAELRLGEVIMNSLLYPKQDDSCETKVLKFKLAKRFCDAKVVEVNASEILEVVKAVSQIYGPMVVGRVSEALGET